MEEGVISSTLFKEEKDEFDSSPEKGDDATTGNVDKEKKGLLLISIASTSVKDSVLSSPKRNAEEERNATEHVECGKSVNVGGEEVDVNANADADQGGCSLDKDQQRSKKEQMESPRKGNHIDMEGDQEKKGLPLISNDLVSVEESVFSFSESKIEEERSGSGHLECSKDIDAGVDVGVCANGDAVQGSCSLGKNEQRKKGEQMESPRKGNDTNEEGDQEKKVFPFISNDLDSVKESVLSFPESKNPRKISVSGHLECSKDIDAGVDVSVCADGDADVVHGGCRLGKDHERRKREQMESPRKGNDTNGEDYQDKQVFPLISNDLDSVKESLLYFPERKNPGETSVSGYLECSKNINVGVCVDSEANANAVQGGCSLGKDQQRRKREQMESPRTGNDTNPEGDQEKKVIHLISNDLASLEESVLSFSESKTVEDKSGPGHLECSKDIDAGVDVGVCAHGDANSNADAVRGGCSLGKDQQRRKKEQMESPRKSNDTNVELNQEKKVFPLMSNDLASVEESVLTFSESKIAEEKSGSGHLECSKDINAGVGVGVCADDEADAVSHTDKGRHADNSRKVKREKRMMSPKKGDDATVEGDREEKGSPLISYSLDSVEVPAVSSSEIKVEWKKSGSELMDCRKDAVEEVRNASELADDGKDAIEEEVQVSDHLACKKDANDGPDVGVNVNGEANADALDKCSHKNGKGSWEKKRKKMRSSECNEEDGSGRKKAKKVHLKAMPMISSDEKAVDGGLSGNVLIEKRKMGIDQSVKKKDDAVKDERTQSFGRLGKKLKGRRGRPPKVRGEYGASVDDGLSGSVLGKKRKRGTDQSVKKKDDKGKDENAQSFGKPGKKMKGRRGRPPKVQGEYGTSVDGGLRRNVLGEKRKRGIDQSVKKRDAIGKDESTQSFGRPGKKKKGRRGRPPKVQGEYGVSEMIGGSKEKVMGPKKNSGQIKGEDIIKYTKFPEVQKKNMASKVTNDEKQMIIGSNEKGDQPKPDTVMGSKFVVDDGQNRLTSRSHHAGKSVNGKQLKTRKQNKENDLGRRGEQQLVREQIVAMLLNAGWTIQYRPRLTKDYSDAVYVDCVGKTYWSVTLAYRVLKKRVEGGDADDKAISAFTPIPEEVLSKLFRQRKQKKEKVKKKKQGQGGSKIVEGMAEKKLLKNKPSTKSIGGSKCKELNPAVRSGDKSSNKNGTTRQGRKPCSLLVRNANKGLDTDNNGFVMYDEKRSLLSWMIDLGTVPPSGKVQYMKSRGTKVMLEGWITRDGIHCDCCDKILTILDFESHAGSRMCHPFENIYLESGISLLQGLLESWSRQEESYNIGFHFVDVDGADPNDDTCNICGDGGDLICCDGCPSTFHQTCLDIQKFPTGDWNCLYCLCKFCGTVAGNASKKDDNQDKFVSELLTCRLCEEKFHQPCIQGTDTINANSSGPSVCGWKCQELFEQLQVLIGVKHELEDGFSWTLLQRSDVSQDISLTAAQIECNSKLAVAFLIMDECFLPIVDERSGINMIRNVVYNCGSNFSRLNYGGFFTAILERGDEIVSTASIRIHGNQLAEMPFIGTRYLYRRQGMCRRLLSAIESALCSLHVEKLVIPAISELLETWTSVFGFKPLKKSKRKELRYISLIVFPGIDMLQKPLLKHQSAEGNKVPTAVSKSTELRTEHQTLLEVSNNSVVRSPAGSDSNVSSEVILQLSNGDEAEAGESSSHLPDVSLNDISAVPTINLEASASNEKCIVHPSEAHDNELVMMGSVNSACDAQQILEGAIRSQSAQSGSITILPDERNVECNSHLNEHSICGVKSKSSTDSQFGSDTADGEGRTTSSLGDGKDMDDGPENKEVKCLKHDPNSTLSSKGRTLDVAKDSDALLLDNSSSKFSCQMDVLESHESELVSSVETKQPPSRDASTAPNSEAACIGDELKPSSLPCHLEASHETSCQVNLNAMDNLKEEFKAAQTDHHSPEGDSLPNGPQLCSENSEQSNCGSPVNHTSVGVCDPQTLCSSSSCPDVTRLCTSGSCNACGVSEVGSCRLLKSGNMC